jgi:hypothetical protein
MAGVSLVRPLHGFEAMKQMIDELLYIYINFSIENALGNI